MGMFDNVVILGEPLACPAGHPLGGLQTKSFRDPSLTTYLIEGDRVVRTLGRSWNDESDEDERSAWRVAGDEAVHETHYRLEPVSPPADVYVYSHCAHCEPVLVRVDRASTWGDIVHEHRVFVEFSLQFPEGEPKRVTRGDWTESPSARKRFTSLSAGAAPLGDSPRPKTHRKRGQSPFSLHDARVRSPRPQRFS